MTKIQSKTSNRQILLASRPVGAPTADNFRLEQSAVPALVAGQLLLRSLYLSLDPFIGLLKGNNFGKLVVRVGAPSTGVLHV